MKVCENSAEELWKHSPAARVPPGLLVLPNFHSCFYFLKRFLVAGRLFSNRSQMTSKSDKKKKKLEMAHEAIAECVNNALTTFLRGV